MILICILLHKDDAEYTSMDSKMTYCFLFASKFISKDIGLFPLRKWHYEKLWPGSCTILTNFFGNYHAKHASKTDWISGDPFRIPTFWFIPRSWFLAWLASIFPLWSSEHHCLFWYCIIVKYNFLFLLFVEFTNLN